MIVDIGVNFLIYTCVQVNLSCHETYNLIKDHVSVLNYFRIVDIC